MPTVYIETSIVSYLRQRPSSHVVMAAHQFLTRKWWDDDRRNHELVTSQYVIDEASKGDPMLAAERLQSLNGIPVLPSFDEEIGEIAAEIMSKGQGIGQRCAARIATVAHHRIEYLLTWNCRHIANCFDDFSPHRTKYWMLAGFQFPSFARRRSCWVMLPKKNDIDSPIIEEIHQTRRAIHDKFGGDIVAIMKDAQQRQEVSGRPVWKGSTANDRKVAAQDAAQSPSQT